MASSNGVPAGFANHDWENDAQWKRFLQGVELPARPAQEAAALRRLKQKYWIRHVDPSATFASESQPASAGTTGSTSEPSAQQQSSGPSSASSGGNARTSSAGTGSTPGPQAAMAQLGPLGLADVAANAAVVLNALALILLGASAAYRWLLFAACATCAIHLYRTLGMPQFSREYLARLMAMESTHYLLLALIYMNESPVLLLVPVLTIYALTNTAAYVSSLASGASGLGRYVQMGTAYVLGKREQLFFAAAYLEILLLPLVVIKFFQGYVGLLAVVVYWQFVAARYRSNARTRAVATSLLGQLDSLVYTYLPSSIGALYHRLRGAPA